MHLPKPFYKLPLRVDIERLRSEVAALPAHAWAPHPNRIEGNTSVRLISADGAENDEVFGAMSPTPHLQTMPYARQLLADFGVVWSRSRLMKLGPHATVPAHADINYHWFRRVRLHIPVFTQPQVSFHCGEECVHMAAGEAWVFDNWRLHKVENPADEARIHLVADTTGSASFWRFVLGSTRADAQVRTHAFDPSRDVRLLTERTVPPLVLNPAEVEVMAMDMRHEFIAFHNDEAGGAQAARFGQLLEEFAQDWRQLHALFGQEPSGWPSFIALRDGLRNASRSHATGLIARTNGVSARDVLEARLLRHALHLPPGHDGHNSAAATPDA